MLTISKVLIIGLGILYSQYVLASWFEQGAAQLQKVLNLPEKNTYAKAKPLSADLPNEYRYSTFRESVFNSEVVILEAGQAHPQTILLVHGLGELGFRDWFNVIPHLSKSYHVVALDLPGFGHSAQPHGRYSLNNYANVLQQLLAQYSQSKKVTIVGHSMGGAISLKFASMYPDRINQLILVDAAGILNKTAFVKALSNLPEPNIDAPFDYQKYWAQFNDFNHALIEKSSLNDGLSELLRNNDLLWNSTVARSPNINAALSLVEEDFSQTLAALHESMTLHLIWGEQDIIAPLRTGKVIAYLRQGASLQVIQEAGHVPMKSHQQQFLNALDKALNSDTIAYRQPIPYIQNQDELHCNGLSSQTYRGYYKKIVLNNCTNIHFQQVKTESLIMHNSLVSFEELSINAVDVAIVAKQSVVSITQGQINAPTAIKSSGSRFDIAGVNFNSQLVVMNDRAPSNYIFSLSSNDAAPKQYLHFSRQVGEEVF